MLNAEETEEITPSNRIRDACGETENAETVNVCYALSLTTPNPNLVLTSQDF